jgi:hypothetical protein
MSKTEARPNTRVGLHAADPSAIPLEKLLPSLLTTLSSDFVACKDHFIRDMETEDISADGDRRYE